MHAGGHPRRDAAARRADGDVVSIDDGRARPARRARRRRRRCRTRASPGAPCASTSSGGTSDDEVGAGDRGGGVGRRLDRQRLLDAGLVGKRAPCPARTSSTTRSSMSHPTTSCPALAICTASGSPILPSATTTARIRAWTRLAGASRSRATASATRTVSRPSSSVTMARLLAADHRQHGLQLGAQRLGLGDRKARHVALGHAALLLQPRRGRAVAVAVQRQVGGQRVGLEHAALAEHARAPDLRRRDPVDVAAERDAAGQPPGHQHEVLVLAAHDCPVCAASDCDRRAAQPAHEVQVVRPEVLDDADVPDAVRERPDALGADQQHLAELVERGGAARSAPG